MVISKEDVERIARLSMLHVEAAEAERLSFEMNAILEFFSSVRDYPAHRSAPREGQQPREDGGCTTNAAEGESIVSGFPAREGRNLNVPRGL